VAETPDQREKRHHQRALFDAVADQYDAHRQSYPDEVVDEMLSTARISRGAAVLEIGCGTGQLTRVLAGRGLSLTAMDLGAAMIANARRRISDPSVEFVVRAFEDLPETRSFDLLASATAFHWIDPEIAFNKAARLLRPAGWLALLTTEERYDEPLRSDLRRLWEKYSREEVNWSDRPPWIEPLKLSHLFGDVVTAHGVRPLTLPRETVLGVERTRATFLSFGRDKQEGFTAQLEALLEPARGVALVQDTFLAMAVVMGAH
jgi:ubiquinone/menaquinone biosynthesis C-methylase UbiE